MRGFSEHQLLGAFLAIAVVLLVTRGMAELSRRLGQPEVLGELLGGFLIGPSILGALFPEAYSALFLNPAVSMALMLLSWIGAILLLMIAGMEADLAILRQKAAPGLLAAAGAIGASLGAGVLIGTRLFGLDPASAFFLGLVLSVTAVSVVAKLLIEREAFTARLRPGDAGRRDRGRGRGVASDLDRVVGSAPGKSLHRGSACDSAGSWILRVDVLRWVGASPIGPCAA